MGTLILTGAAWKLTKAAASNLSMQVKPWWRSRKETRERERKGVL